MRENIAQLNGDINSSNIRCKRCTTRQSGGFDPDYGIRICANELRNQGHLEDTMAHEMVHAYDHLRFKTEWRDNLRHAACTEVGWDGYDSSCKGHTDRASCADTSFFVERRMSVDARVLHSRTVEAYPATPGMCAPTSCPFTPGQTHLQG